jgi:uncharacterized damage-inducible protein DinB
MQPVEEMFAHHQWATLRLIDHCAGLMPDQLSLTIPGTRGRVDDTLVHLVAADGRYLSSLTGDDADATLKESEPPPSVGEMRPVFERQAARWHQLLSVVDDLDVTLRARGPYPDTPHATNLLLLQAIHHGNDHRTQICSILGANGLEVPDLDGWHYWSSRARSSDL